MRLKSILAVMVLVAGMAIVPGSSVMADDAPEVTIQNYVRAETDLQMRNYVESMDALPEEEAYYLNVDPNLPVGAYELTVRDVPVDAFWSVTVYIKDGFIDPNDEDAYSVNNLTGTANDDGSYTIHFGGEPGSVNHLPIAEGWNYSVRLYQPRKEVLDGSWKFPEVKSLA
jgi:hypothetical protein